MKLFKVLFLPILFSLPLLSFGKEGEHLCEEDRLFLVDDLKSLVANATQPPFGCSEITFKVKDSKYSVDASTFLKKRYFKQLLSQSHPSSPNNTCSEIELSGFEHEDVFVKLLRLIYKNEFTAFLGDEENGLQKNLLAKLKEFQLEEESLTVLRIVDITSDEQLKEFIEVVDSIESHQPSDQQNFLNKCQNYLLKAYGEIPPKLLTTLLGRNHLSGLYYDLITSSVEGKSPFTRIKIDLYNDRATVFKFRDEFLLTKPLSSPGSDRSDFNRDPFHFKFENALKHCRNLGEGWVVPTAKDYEIMAKALTTQSTGYRGGPFAESDRYYWTSSKNNGRNTRFHALGGEIVPSTTDYGDLRCVKYLK